MYILKKKKMYKISLHAVNLFGFGKVSAWTAEFYVE